MGDLVDLDAFRKQRQEEDEAKARADAEAKAAEEQADIDYMRDLLHRLMTNISDSVSGSMIHYVDVDGHTQGSYSTSDDFAFNTYYHEAGYDENGYYERSWELDPMSDDVFGDWEDDEDF